MAPPRPSLTDPVGVEVLRGPQQRRSHLVLFLLNQRIIANGLIEPNLGGWLQEYGRDSIRVVAERLNSYRHVIPIVE